uniref:DegT/DnrJ/EryC1/StrS aminotransferase n=1 Tax=Solibacter usitatus (strain Ellin6076) TaxID=234267 RepID=Q01WZ6_SOLUE
MIAPFIHFHRPSIGEEEISEVVETLRSGWLTTGPRAARFERDFQEYTGAPHAVAVNSATAGLHIALAALKIGPGDEVITTPMTFCATVQTILHVGATPVLADIGWDGNIDPQEIAARITDRTKAIIPVHMAGLPCDMASIWSLARKHGIHVIEDAAHAAGARYAGLPIGSGESDAVAFSFYATKNLTTGEGGMITTQREELAQTMRMLALHGVSHEAWDRYSEKGSWQYDVLAHGFKYNLSDIQAALGIHQLRKLDEFIERRTRYARMYDTAFAGMEEVETPPDNPQCRHAWHLYIPRLNLRRLKLNRARFIRELQQRGIGTSVHFIPIPLLRYFARLPLAQYACPRALDLYPRIVSLPLYPAMTEEQVQYVARNVRELLESSRRGRLVAAGTPAAMVPATVSDIAGS